MALLVIALIGLAIGIWLGLPGKYEQTPEDIEELMARGGGSRRRREKRSISPVAWLQRKLGPSGPPSRRRGFKLSAPGERPEGARAGVNRRAAQPPRDLVTGDAASAEEPRPRRTRENLREGRFKLRPPGEAGPR